MIAFALIIVCNTPNGTKLNQLLLIYKWSRSCDRYVLVQANQGAVIFPLLREIIAPLLIYYEFFADLGADFYGNANK